MAQGKVYEIYAGSVSHGDLFGFIEVEKLVFGERTSVVVDPSEEKIKTEFEGVKRTYIPMHAVIRIDEVEKQGISKVTDAEGSNVTQFPVPMYTPPGAGGGVGVGVTVAVGRGVGVAATVQPEFLLTSNLIGHLPEGASYELFGGSSISIPL